MAKKKLIIEYTFDFDLFGIVASEKEYKLAWSINQKFGINLKKQQDILLELVGNKKLTISNYIFETENSSFRFFKNKSMDVEDGDPLYLLPEVKNFDFLIMIEDEGDSLQQEQVPEKLSQIPIIQYYQKFDLNKLKSKENLLF